MGFIKLVKQMLALIQENSTFIETKRKGVAFGVGDLAAVDRWEADLKEKGTPLKKYLDTYKVKRIEELRMADATRDREREKDGEKKRKREDGDDDDDDDDDEDMVDLTEEDFANAGSGSEEEEDDDDDDDDDEVDQFDRVEFKDKLQTKKLSKAELKKLKAQKDVVEEFDLGESDDETKAVEDGEDDNDYDDDDDSEED